MASFERFIGSLHSDADKRGKQFERFVKWFLTHDPEWSTQVDQIWLWDDFPGRWGRDCGIDLTTTATIQRMTPVVFSHASQGLGQSVTGWPSTCRRP